MLHLLIDTCVWLDMAKDHRQQATLLCLEQLVKDESVSLLLPEQVIDEFSRNRDRIIRQNQQSLSSVFKRVKETVNLFGDEAHRQNTLDQLNDVDHRIAVLSEAVTESIDHVERLFGMATILRTTDTIKLKAADRAITKRVPFHKNKNSIGDAILLEIFAEAAATKSKMAKMVFVTHNTRDFSTEVGDKRDPHADILDMFSGDGTSYSISLADVLNELQPDLLEEARLELEFTHDVRRLSDLLEAARKLSHLVWYNRHLNLLSRIQDGAIKVVTKEEWDKTSDNSRFIVDEIWVGARAAAREVENEFGPEIGPWDDFEWGMINGKLSAVRWMIGDEWDMLDT